MDRAMDFVQAGEIKQQDVAIFWYICTSLDGETGEAIRRYETIAEACGLSRRTAIRAIDRLKAVGLVVSRARSYKKTRGDLANAYSLGIEAFPSRSGSQMSPGECHERHSISSQNLHIPNGNQHANPKSEEPSSTGHAIPGPTNQVPDVDWEELASWLAKFARFEERYGFGAAGLARDDLERLRDTKGDKALLRAIEIAKAKKLYGEPLEDFLRKTWPTRRRNV